VSTSVFETGGVRHDRHCLLMWLTRILMLSTGVVDQDADNPGTSVQPSWLADNVDPLVPTT